MPVQTGDHFLHVKELARGHHVIWIENEQGEIVFDKWIDHKPTQKEIAKVAEEFNDALEKGLT